METQLCWLTFPWTAVIASFGLIFGAYQFFRVRREAEINVLMYAYHYFTRSDEVISGFIQSGISQDYFLNATIRSSNVDVWHSARLTALKYLPSEIVRVLDKRDECLRALGELEQTFLSNRFGQIDQKARAIQTELVKMAQTDCDRIEHAQLYAQRKEVFLNTVHKEPYWFEPGLTKVRLENAVNAYMSLNSRIDLDYLRRSSSKRWYQRIRAK